MTVPFLRAITVRPDVVTTALCACTSALQLTTDLGVLSNPLLYDSALDYTVVRAYWLLKVLFALLLKVHIYNSRDTIGNKLQHPCDIFAAIHVCRQWMGNVFWQVWIPLAFPVHIALYYFVVSSVLEFALLGVMIWMCATPSPPRLKSKSTFWDADCR